MYPEADSCHPPNVLYLDASSTSGSDGTVRIWDHHRAKNLRIMKGHGGTVTTVAWAGPGRLLSGAADSTVRLWDGRRARVLRTFQGHRSAVTAMETGAVEGETVFASGARDGTLMVTALPR